MPEATEPKPATRTADELKRDPLIAAAVARVADAITDIPGSSGYFLGGIVSYADSAKADLLGVPTEVLAAHGAVSAQVGRAMAEGARERFAADLAAAVTGVAGPDGGSEAKPVGLTYVAIAAAQGADVRRFVWTGDRAANKEASASAVLEILVEWARRAGKPSDADSPDEGR
jgi:PncC family amidohydrolase